MVRYVRDSSPVHEDVSLADLLKSRSHSWIGVSHERGLFVDIRSQNAHSEHAQIARIVIDYTEGVSSISGYGVAAVADVKVQKV